MALSKEIEDRVDQIEEILKEVDDLPIEERNMLRTQISTVLDLHFIRTNGKVG